MADSTMIDDTSFLRRMKFSLFCILISPMAVGMNADYVCTYFGLTLLCWVAGVIYAHYQVFWGKKNFLTEKKRQKAADDYVDEQNRNYHAGKAKQAKENAEYAANETPESRARDDRQVELARIRAFVNTNYFS